MQKRYIVFCDILVALVTVATGVTSCSGEALTEAERNNAAFQKALGGEVSPMQWWRTAVTIKVNVETNAPVKLWLMSDEDKGTLFDYREIAASSMVDMTAPQGQGNTLYLVSVCKRKKKITSISLNGRTEETVTLSTQDNDTKSRKSQAENVTTIASHKAKDGENKVQANGVEGDARDVATSLYGSSVNGDAEYNQLTEKQKKEGLDLLTNYYQEYVNAKDLGLNTDYELESKGDFRITWFAGNCMSSTPHILGYYYHTPGTYDDIQYVDLSETEIYDYIDGKAKVQYQINEAAAQQYGLETNHWYDANFDMKDTFDDNDPYLSSRKGDDAYSTISVFHRYGRNISAIRGVSFVVKAPAGKHVGFYDRVEEVEAPEQYDRFVKLGIQPYTSRGKYKMMNFSCEAMNMTRNGSHRSCIVPTENSYWLGMENTYDGGDLDCNDVIFEVSSPLDIYRPTIVEPDLAPFGEYDDKMPWTIAYEDVYRDADYDFNDAVIKVVPDYENEKCCVTVMAAGSKQRMYLHYDGPDGDQNLGEIHELLGGSTDTEINTKTSMAQTAFVNIDCVRWPKGYNMADDAKRFYIEVKRGSCSDCSDVITLPQEAGETPEALLIAGEWKWPKEGVNVMTTYDTFSSWCKDITKMAYWNWYSYPKSNTYVNY